MDVRGLRVKKGEVLTDSGTDLGAVNSVIWSHSHSDHIENLSLFSSSTKIDDGIFIRAHDRAYVCTCANEREELCVAGGGCVSFCRGAAIESVSTYAGYTRC